jgi:CubicO group peptidase (beta-lactamase class C family)
MNGKRFARRLAPWLVAVAAVAGHAAQTFDPAHTPVLFRAMETAFPVRTVPAGGGTSALVHREAPRPFRYRHEGQTRTLADYVARRRATGLLVARAGEVLAEHHGLGAAPGDRFTSWSMAKSVTSTLIGIALAEGDIASLDDPVTAYVPELEESAWAGTTIRQVLRMTSGVAFDETYGADGADVTHFFEHGVRGGRVNAVLLDFDDRSAEPGTRFNYSTADTQVLGWVLARATGEEPAAYLADRLWGPIGAATDALWITDAPNGTVATGMGISATLEDWARFGRFAARGGVTGTGRTVALPEGWFAEATRPLDAVTGHGALYPDYPLGYGYQWWSFPDGSFEAQGVYGQILFVDPALELVIVLTSAWETAWDDAAEAEFMALVQAVRAELAAGSGVAGS